MPLRTLFDFLTRTRISPILMLEGTPTGPNTTSPAWNPKDLNVHSWRLSYKDIACSPYFKFLESTLYDDRHLPLTPPEPVTSERAVESRLEHEVLKRLQRALKIPFPPGHSVIRIDVAGAARFAGSNCKPDLLGFVGFERNERVVRIPGDVKCAWKWRSTWWRSFRGFEETEFRVVAAQLNFYMNQAGARYGYIITNEEVVLFRKLDNKYASYVEMAPGIPISRYDSQGRYSAHAGEITALLGLWYIHMLAAYDNGWDVKIFSDPEEDEDGSGSFGNR